MKKITFVISSLGSGGAERVVSTLSNELTDRGYAVSIVLVVSSEQRYTLDPRIRVCCLDCEGDLEKNVLRRLGLRLKKIRKALAALQPDLVISFLSEINIDVCLATVGTRTPVIVSERNNPAIDPASRAKRLLRRIAYLRSRGFVFQTPDAQSYFPERIRQKSRIILNPLMGVIPEPFQGTRQKRIVAVGRLNQQKNYPLMIEAFRRFHKTHPDYILEIYGEGELRQQIQREIQDQGLEDRVYLKGFCRDVHAAIREAAFFVMSSDFEGMPNSLIEAMALGLPCISTDCPSGGPWMLIRNTENGLLVPIRDPAALEKAMRTLAEDPRKAGAMGRAAAELRKQTDVKIITDQWEEFMEPWLRR